MSIASSIASSTMTTDPPVAFTDRRSWTFATDRSRLEHLRVHRLVPLGEVGLRVQRPQLAGRQPVGHEVDQIPALALERRERQLGLESDRACCGAS